MVGLLVLLVLIAIIFALQTKALRIFVVVSESMEPTLLIGDRILIDAEGYPERFDVVAFQDPEKPNHPEEQLVKRIIGLEGDVVEIRGGILYINKQEQFSQLVASNQIFTRDMRVKVPPGRMFVMGDNRNHSYDSVDFGPVPLENLSGILSLVLWPPGRWGSVEAFDQAPVPPPVRTTFPIFPAKNVTTADAPAYP